MISLNDLLHGKWPSDMTVEDMESLHKDQMFDTKPFRPPLGMGHLGIHIVCSCGCGHGAKYHLTRRKKYEIHGDPWGVEIRINPTLNVEITYVDVWVLAWVQSPESYSTLADRMRGMIPGATDVVENPCDCFDFQRTVWDMIQHLNDEHHPAKSVREDKWSRERIADWLETLDADLTLDPERKQEPVQPKSMKGPTISHGFFDEHLQQAMQNGVASVQASLQQIGLSIAETGDTFKAMQESIEEES